MSDAKPAGGSRIALTSAEVARIAADLKARAAALRASRGSPTTIAMLEDVARRDDLGTTIEEALERAAVTR